MGCSPWGHEESDTTERLHCHFSVSCIGEGNGNPLQCSCLENPRDGGTWWAAVSGVAQSRTRLKRLSSSSSIPFQGASLVAQWRRISLQGNRCGFDPWVRKTSWRMEWHPIPLLLPGKSHGQWNLVGYSPWGHKRVRHNLATAAAVLRQSCLTLCNPTDNSSAGSPVPGILQARTLEWVAISVSNACMHAKLLQLCPTLCDPMDSSPPGSSVHRIV